MLTDKPMSATAWTWTINELCRKVEMVDPQVIFGSYLSRKTDPFHATPIVLCVPSSLDGNEKEKTKE